MCGTCINNGAGTFSLLETASENNTSPSSRVVAVVNESQKKIPQHFPKPKFHCLPLLCLAIFCTYSTLLLIINMENKNWEKSLAYTRNMYLYYSSDPSTNSENNTSPSSRVVAVVNDESQKKSLNNFPCQNFTA